MPALHASGDGAPEVALLVEDLCVEFSTSQGVARAVDHLSLRLNESETIGIVGESGCGKSVTGLSLMRLLPSPPARVTHGSAHVRRHEGGHVDLLALPRSALPDYRGRDIAMIFQEPMTSLNPLRTIGDQVAEPMIVHQGLSRRHAFDRAADLLARVGLSDGRNRLGSYPHELSGGMRQRIMIAMALSCEPAVLIADEPTTALDVTVQAQILELFRTIQSSSRMGILFITHDLGVVAEIAQRVVVMYAGQIVEEGSVATVLRNPAHPYTAGLLASLPRIDRPQRDRESFYAIPGHVPELLHMPSGCRFQPRCAHAVSGLCNTPQILETVNEDHTVRCVRWRDIETGDHA